MGKASELSMLVDELKKCGETLIGISDGMAVHKGMKLEIQFHSGIVVKQEVDYYE